MMATRRPTEAEIQQVMKETGMEWMQSYNHLVQRFFLQDMAQRGVTQQTRAQNHFRS